MSPKDIAEKILKAFDNQFIDAASMIIDCRDLARAYLELEAENEKLKFQSSIFNDTLKQNRDLKKKLRLANDTIHGEFCGEKCHPLHLEVEI